MEEKIKNISSYKQMAPVQVNNGETCLFWQDNWGGQSLEITLPEFFFSFANNKIISVAFAGEPEDRTQLLQLSISEIAYTQLQNINQRIADIHLNEEHDIWQYTWGNNFSSSRAY